jgi:hypothetical protein
MKKFLLFVSLLVLTIACTAPPTNQDAARDTNRNTSDSEPPAPAPSESAAIAQEKAIWDTIKNKDYNAFGRMLADDQVEVGSEGLYDKAGTIASVKDFEPTEMSFTDWKFLPINNEAIVLTYTVALKGKYKGKEFPPESIRASTAWVNRNGKWLAMYHQSSPITTAPPPPPAAASSPKTSTSPAAPTAITTGPDPIANERAIWEALRAKNYDGFAGALAADSLEVEPAGVYDKAGSVKLVQGFDFSKAELSDFKAAPFDAGTALVTYRVKMPGPDPVEYHSTIWARRDGKWLAVFHQGTPIVPAPEASASPAMK